MEMQNSADEPPEAEGRRKRLTLGKAKYLITRYATHLFNSILLSGLDKQEEIVDETSWDTLIILDACRYDYFAMRYPHFFEGKLKKLKSPASWTYNWLPKVFGDTYNITVYSAHPGINSRGTGRRMGYVASDHFKKIVDVWDLGWDPEVGTVHPSKINEAVLNDLKDGKFVGKNLIWYIQPHSPWIGKTRLSEPRDNWNDKKALGELIRKFKSGEVSWSLLQQAYSDNLDLVLEHVSQLLPHLPGKTVITSDHGELLGEWNRFGHPGHLVLTKLREVPWLEVDNVLRVESKIQETQAEMSERNNQAGSEEDQEKMMKRLKQLGYF